MEGTHIHYHGKDYTVYGIKYKNAILPVLIDGKHSGYIDRLGKKWRCTGPSVQCSHNGRIIYMHELIRFMADDNVKKNIPLVHINRLGLDNREDNIIYDTHDKAVNKTLKKKERTVTLPKGSGIDRDDIPTYVWYMKPTDTHGDRFMVKIDDIMWKTTSSTSVTLREKLDDAKEFLRGLKQDRPELFQEYSMNGDFTQRAKDLLRSYVKICRLAGYDISDDIIRDRTDEYLR